jgi:hypothetical protein
MKGNLENSGITYFTHPWFVKEYLHWSKPMNLTEIAKSYHSEESARAFLEAQRWRPMASPLVSWAQNGIPPSQHNSPQVARLRPQGKAIS